MKKIRFFWAFLLLSLPFVAFSQRGNVVFDSVAVNGTLNLDITRLQGTAIGVIGFDNTGKVVTTQATANVTNNNYGVANGVRVLTY